MKHFNQALALVITLSGTANADTFCADVSGLAAGRATSIELEVVSPTPAKCGLAQGVGNVHFTHCAWPFAFRAPEATAAFKTTSAALAHCPTAQLRAFEDQSVNHPDSYDLRIFDLEGAEVSLSLKDKGALQQTYVFLRVQAK